MAVRSRSSTESTSDLYLRLGLDYNELESGFVQAEHTLRDNMTRLSRENTIIDLQAQVEILGLDETNDAERIFELRVQSLNRKLANQRDKVRLAAAELQNMKERTGENSVQTQRAQLAFERERNSLAQLEQQLRRTQEAQEDLNDAENDAGSSSGGGFNFDVDSIADELGLDQIPRQAKLAAAAIAGIATAIVGAVKVTDDLITKWSELQKQAYELNMSVNDTEDFLRHMRLAGGDIGDFEGFIRGLSDAYVKGEYDDPEFIALRKEGAIITDNTGRLKDFKDLTEEVYQAWKKADAAGEGIEFLQMVGGEAGVRDTIQYFRRYEEAKEDKPKIFDSGIDPEKMHEAERAFKLLDEQMGEFKNAAENLITPVTVELAKAFFDVFHWGTEKLVDVKKAFSDLGDAIGEVFDNPMLSALKLKKKLGFDLSATEKAALDVLETIEKTNKKIDETTKDGKSKKKQGDLNPLSQYGDNRSRQLEDDIKKLKIEIQYENEYQKAVAEANYERQLAYRQLNVSAKERAAIEEKYRTDIKKAEKDHNDKLEDMERETSAIQYEISHSAYEKEIYDIEQWKKKALEDLGEYKDAIGDKNRWLKESAAITAQAAAKEAQAFEKEMDRIKGKFQSLEEKIFELEHSQYENDIAKIFKEAREMLDEGIGADRVARYVELAVAKVNREATPEKLKRPDYQMVNIPDFSQYEKLQEQIELDMENYKQNIEKPDLKISDEQFNLQEKLAAPVQIATDSINSLNLSVGNVGTSFDSVGYSAGILADSFKNATTKINDLQIIPPAKNLQPLNQNPNKSLTPDINFPPPKIADDNADKLKAADQKVAGNAQGTGLSKIPDLAKLTSQVAELTRIAGTIAQDISKKQQAAPPNITVSPNINLSLNGSYILTQTMVNNMQNDITAEVASAITDAVKQATNQISI